MKRNRSHENLAVWRSVNGNAYTVIQSRCDALQAIVAMFECHHGGSAKSTFL